MICFTASTTDFIFSSAMNPFRHQDNGQVFAINICFRARCSEYKIYLGDGIIRPPPLRPDKPHSARPPLEAPEGVAAYAAEGGLVPLLFSPLSKKEARTSPPSAAYAATPSGASGEVWRSGAWRRSDGSDASAESDLPWTSPPLEAQRGTGRRGYRRTSRCGPQAINLYEMTSTPYHNFSNRLTAKFPM